MRRCAVVPELRPALSGGLADRVTPWRNMLRCAGSQKVPHDNVLRVWQQTGRGW
jgi:hypothetical protein